MPVRLKAFEPVDRNKRPIYLPLRQGDWRPETAKESVQQMVGTVYAMLTATKIPQQIM